MNIAALNVRIGADVSGLSKGMRKASEQLNALNAPVKKMESSMGGLQRRLSTVGTSLGRSLVSPLAGLATVGGLAAGFQKVVAAADQFDASQRKLASTAKITGQNLGFLQKTSADMQRTFGVSASTANDFTTEIVKLTTKAGAIGQTTQALAAFLDLGAARGLTASQTLEKVSQAVLGIDEGTDALFGKNPSALYEEFAAAAGKPASSLTESGKALAILSAGMRDGGKVAGEYAEFLKSPAGQAYQLQVRTEQAAASIGRSMQGIRTAVYPILAGLADRIVGVVTQIQLLGAQLPVFFGRVRLELARINEASGGLVDTIIGGLQEANRVIDDRISTLPKAIRIPLEFVRGTDPTKPLVNFAADAAGTSVTDAVQDLARLRAASDVEMARIRENMNLATSAFGNTNPIETFARAFEDKLQAAGRQAREFADQVEAALERAMGGKLAQASLRFIAPKELGTPTFASTASANAAGLREMQVSAGTMIVKDVKTYHAPPAPVEATSNLQVLRDSFSAALERFRGFSVRSAVSAAPDNALGGLMSFVKGIGAGFSQLFTSLGPMALAMEVVGGIFAALGPVLDTLMIPLRNVGHLIGSVIAPILQALQPVLNTVAKAFSYVIEGIGKLLRGIGDFLNKFLPNYIGDPLKKFGQNMIDSAVATRAAINSQTDLTKTVASVSESLSNVPPIFDLLTRRREAAAGFTPGSDGRIAAPTGGANIHVTINNPSTGVDVERLARDVERALVNRLRLGGTTELGLGFAL